MSHNKPGVIPAFLRCGGYGFLVSGSRGRVLRKEDTPMKHFLRDVLAAFVAAVLAALVIRLLNL